MTDLSDMGRVNMIADQAAFKPGVFLRWHLDSDHLPHNVRLGHEIHPGYGGTHLIEVPTAYAAKVSLRGFWVPEPKNSVGVSHEAATAAPQSGPYDAES